MALLGLRITFTEIAALTALGPNTRSRNSIKQPLQFSGRKIGLRHQASFFLNDLGMSGVAQRITCGRGATVLPYDRVGQRFTGLTIPQHSRFPLIGDTDGHHLRRGNRHFRQRLARHAQLRALDFICVVFDPARLRENLANFLLGRGVQPSLCIK